MISLTNEKEHAKLSASGSKRWMECPGSVILEALLPDETSAYAEEGTKAHELAEAKLYDLLKKHSPHDQQALKKNCDAEMDIATDKYMEYIIDILDALKLEGHTAYTGIEARVCFDNWVPGGFGTIDFFAVGGTHLHIVDLKYGKGVPVSAVDNPQPRAYSLGFLQDYELIYDNIEDVTYHIVQPRINNYSSETLTVKELTEWANTVLKVRADIAWAGTREYNPGEAQCKFCKANAICRARASRILNTIAQVLNPAK